MMLESLQSLSFTLNHFLLCNSFIPPWWNVNTEKLGQGLREKD